MDLVFAPSQIEIWPLARLRPYARNAKMHGEDQVAKIGASMAKFGWTVPCMVAEDGELIAGHGRVLAAAQLGLTESPVIVLDHLTEAQRRVYRIADNKLTELGGWDEALLVEELRGLMEEEFDLGLIGIPEDELDPLLHDAGEDRAPIDDDTADTICEPCEKARRYIDLPSAVVLKQTARATHQGHRPDAHQATMIFLRIGPSGISPDRKISLRGRHGKRQQQPRKQGSEKAEAGETEGSGNGKFRCGETGFARREEEELSLRAAARDRFSDNEKPPSRQQDGGLARSSVTAQAVSL